MKIVDGAVYSDLQLIYNLFSTSYFSIEYDTLF